MSFVSSNEGATYRWMAAEAEHEGHTLRLIVVESSALDKKKENTLTCEREAERDRLTQAAKEAAQTPFHCRADAQQAAEAFRAGQSPRFHQVDVTVRPQEVVRKNGDVRSKAKLPKSIRFTCWRPRSRQTKRGFTKRAGGRPASCWPPPCRPSDVANRWRGRRYFACIKDKSTSK
ncbi:MULTISPECIES: hypothetical protein [unclassified Paenibacillus]|uniref:hypothetical protein n=1 Tax=unclassified Paenibacillus TaxID=185978 RepID=UPI000B16539D|nr:MULTISPECIES: hypothetical protein [unclassified Paenibacillus]